jgi:hypothetical protein
MADIDKLATRPAAYLSETGVPYLIGGFLIFLFGGCELVTSVLPKNFLAQEGPKWLAVLFCITNIWIARAIYKRYVYPRGGYVELRQRRMGGIPIAGAIGAAVALFGTLFWWGRLDVEYRPTCPAFAVIFAAIAFTAGFREKSAPAAWFGVYLLVLAPVLWWIPGGLYDRFLWLAVAVGLPMAVFGAIRLWRFVKTHPLTGSNSHE